MIDIATEIFLIVAMSATVSAVVYYALFSGHFTRQVVTLAIIGKQNMSTVVEGRTLAFTVVAKNAAGVVVPDAGISASVDAGSVSVASDGSAGVFTAPGPGVATISVTDGTRTATLSVTVTPDVTPATPEIVPA